MKYGDLKRLKDKKFKKLVGIPKDLFDLLITTLQPHFESKGSKGGPKPKLCIEDILLMTLYFYRNYVTGSLSSFWTHFFGQIVLIAIFKFITIPFF